MHHATIARLAGVGPGPAYGFGDRPSLKIAGWQEAFLPSHSGAAAVGRKNPRPPPRKPFC